MAARPSAPASSSSDRKLLRAFHIVTCLVVSHEPSRMRGSHMPSASYGPSEKLQNSFGIPLRRATICGTFRVKGAEP